MRIATAVLIAIALTGCGRGPVKMDGPTGGWPHYGNDAGGTRFSALTQIDRGNVKDLKVAWEYHTGESLSGRGAGKKAFEATPVLLDGVLYFITPSTRVIAIEAETGREVWRFDPEVDFSRGFSEYTSRGVAAWRDPQAVAGTPCQSRIVFGTVDARLMAIDAKEGKRCAGFGQGGQVDLKVGVGKVRAGDYQVTSPPVIVGDVAVVGSAIGDNGAVELERGVVRGFDVRTGALRWAWDPIPRHVGDDGRETWEGTSADRTGAANAWAPLSADVERDLVFVPTGSASPDFYGGERLGDNLYANSVMALRGSTGERVWAFQVVHHDVWDYDVASQPVLLTVRKDGRAVPAVAQATKMGFVYFLDRETGKPLFPVEEKRVPQTDVPGERTSPTQPMPAFHPPVVPQGMRADQAWGLTPWDRGKCREEMSQLRQDGAFTPPSLQGSLMSPGNAGGPNWGSLAWEPSRGLAIVNANVVPFAVKLIPREQFRTWRGKKGHDLAPQTGTPYGVERYPILSPLGMPCSAPPWGTLTALDIEGGKIRWQVPLGTIRDLAPVPLPFHWGTPNMGGPMVTASGLIFIGAAMDHYLRAFDVENGEELWKARLPAPANATPMTFRLGKQSRQFVVVAAGGHGKLGTKLSDSVLGFALP